MSCYKFVKNDIPTSVQAAGKPIDLAIPVTQELHSYVGTTGFPIDERDEKITRNRCQLTPYQVTYRAWYTNMQLTFTEAYIVCFLQAIVVAELLLEAILEQGMLGNE